MLPLTASALRASFVNASRKELGDLPLPPDLDVLAWDSLEFLGWRDPKLPRRAYVVVPVDGEPVGVVLRQAEATPRARAQCSLCQDVTLPAPVAFLSAKRAGAAGRNGDTVGTLVCAAFQCSVNAHRPPPPAYLGFDVAAAVEQRVLSLRERAAGFARTVLDGR
ncbi:FBP domain-containing protein [Frigoribacterium faeni]|uniref:FBP domain-containing protein n=1 Tax=Frigoribacterium faeni TaxID=145483 RepID=UPI00141B45DE|nr:FBP domain-containing protein [Frigoribacterium faeni]NIJ05454.1 hypothetical protein [Frigoribacterium faeni]